jgi:hypothetical protein
MARYEETITYRIFRRWKVVLLWLARKRRNCFWYAEDIHVYIRHCGGR